MEISIGLQLYSVRNALAAHPWGTLEALSEAGFTTLEAANHNALHDPGVGFGVSAKDLRNKLGDLNLSVIGCHINPLDLDILPRALEYQAELGNTQIGCDIDFFPIDDRDFILRRAEVFNQVGELAKSHGLRFYYHNHFQEFQRCGNQFAYEIILENTDPDLVKLEMDTYWMYRGGQDPLVWMNRYANRVVLLHQKDFPEGAPQSLNMFDGVVDPQENIDMQVFLDNKDPRCFVEIGTGVLPIQDIIDAAAKLPHLDFMVLEQDFTQMDEIDSVRTSRDAFITKFTGTRWD